MLASRIESRWRGFAIRAVIYVWHGLQIRASMFKEERTNFHFTKSSLHPHKNNIVHRR